MRVYLIGEELLINFFIIIISNIFYISGQRCEKCNEYFTSANILETHLLSVHGSLLYDKCDETLVDETTLSKHYLKKHNTECTNECEQYQDNYPDIYHMDNHFCRMSLCPACNQTVTRKQPNKCVDDKMVVGPLAMCSFCGKGMSRNSWLKHRPYCIKPAIKEFVCDICEARFFFENNLKSHESTSHPRKDEEIACVTCAKLFTSQINLRRHIRNVHNNRHTVRCDKCGKSFSNQSNLTVHERLHTGELPAIHMLTLWQGLQSEVVHEGT